MKLREKVAGVEKTEEVPVCGLIRKTPSFCLGMCFVGGKSFGGSWVPGIWLPAAAAVPVPCRSMGSLVNNTPFSILPTVVTAFFSVPKPCVWWDTRQREKQSLHFWQLLLFIFQPDSCCVF